jgi:peptidoglycan/LPS O-acetylase OafA/YrhL
MPQEVLKFDFIDALRGYAILGVLMVHSGGFVSASSPFLTNFMALGKSGVQLFYIASALTLCMSWEFRKKHEAYPVRNFFIRRFFRIAPMFYVQMT